VEVGEVAAQAERSTSPDPEVALRAVARLRRLAAQLEADQVAAARRAGWTWQEIALGLGVTKQTVHRKYRHREERQWIFQGDEPAVRMVLRRAVGSARRLGHPRVGVEHLLVGLAGGDDVVATVLARHGATCDVLEDTARAAAPLGAGAAAELSRWPWSVSTSTVYSKAGSPAP